MALRRRQPARCIVLRAIWGCLLLPALPVVHGQPAAVPDALAAAMSAADAAAGTGDYEASLLRLAEAADLASGERLVRIARRRALYERFLAMDELLTLARENQGQLVGIGATRSGKSLAGLVQLFELGVTPGAAIGNRLLDKGSLLLRMADGSGRLLPGDQIARIQVLWEPPQSPSERSEWTIGSLRVMLQSGEEIVGSPTWVMCMGSMSFRAPGAEEDADIVALPLIGREFSPDDLAAELLLIGAPLALRPEGPVGDTEEAAAAAPGGPAYLPPTQTDQAHAVGSTRRAPEPSAGEDRCPPAGATKPAVQEKDHE